MNDTHDKTTRRSFFLQGGAVLGAGMAATAANSALASGAASSPAHPAADREAIRQVHALFTRNIETADYDAAAALFDTRARLELSAAAVTGAGAIEAFFATQYAQQQSTQFHAAYRRGAAQADETIEIHEDGSATAVFPAEAQLCAPLAATCTAAQMARLQGHVAERRWEPGRFDARYVRTTRGWKIADLRWSAATG